MTIKYNIKSLLPVFLKDSIRPLLNCFLKKNTEELNFWRSRLEIDKGIFENSHYKKYMLAMAEESNIDFVKDKVVADFGCGPRGSLTWAKSATFRIGIDVLADRYIDEFTSNILSHNMIYLKSTENVIPLPSGIVDILFTLNAIDHVDNFPIMCSEILRVIKPGGLFIGSFNLEERATSCEPQRLNEKIINDNLLTKLEVLSYRVTTKGHKDDQYAPFFAGNLSYKEGQEGFLWVKAKKSLDERF
ncbi:MAG: class I SAM-dependent methyltransferase [Candidatus Cloacimonetes bacterium]|nr:class I SAM-dependent methyltransferase [Candidatus Cloacimonadota bacterium]